MVVTDQQLENFQAALRMFCDAEEVAATIDVRVEDLDEIASENFDMTFDECRAHFAAQGRATIKHAQFTAALDGDRSMLLALGKQYLGQDFDNRKPMAKEEASDGTTVLSLVQGALADAPDRKSTA